jgi:site-specific recombinase XerD
MGMTLGENTPGHGLAVITTTAMATMEAAPVEAVLGAWMLSLRAPHTRAAYHADMQIYLDHLEGYGLTVFTAPRAAVDMWVDLMTTDGLAPSTIARRLSAVRSFYRYATDTGAASVNPTAGVRTPYVSPEAVKAGLSLAETRAVVDAAINTPGRATRATVALLLGAALRVSEATAATVEHISPIDGHTVLQVTGKGGRRRMVPLSPLAMELLTPLPAEGHLIPGPDGGACNRYQLAHLVRTVGKAAGIGRSISPHILRHTAATVALDGGAPIQTVADLLGHSSPTTTMRYVAGRERLRDSAAYVLATALTVGT